MAELHFIDGSVSAYTGSTLEFSDISGYASTLCAVVDNAGTIESFSGHADDGSFFGETFNELRQVIMNGVHLLPPKLFYKFNGPKQPQEQGGCDIGLTAEFSSDYVQFDYNYNASTNEFEYDTFFGCSEIESLTIQYLNYIGDRNLGGVNGYNSTIFAGMNFAHGNGIQNLYITRSTCLRNNYSFFENVGLIDGNKTQVHKVYAPSDGWTVSAAVHNPSIYFEIYDELELNKRPRLKLSLDDSLFPDGPISGQKIININTLDISLPISSYYTTTFSPFYEGSTYENPEIAQPWSEYIRESILSCVKGISALDEDPSIGVISSLGPRAFYGSWWKRLYAEMAKGFDEEHSPISFPSLTNIGASAFYIDDNNISVDDLNGGQRKWAFYIDRQTFGTQLTSIGEYAFANYASSRQDYDMLDPTYNPAVIGISPNANLFSSLEYIDDYAFCCANLSSYDMHSAVETSLENVHHIGKAGFAINSSRSTQNPYSALSISFLELETIHDSSFDRGFYVRTKSRESDYTTPLDYVRMPQLSYIISEDSDDNGAQIVNSSLHALGKGNRLAFCIDGYNSLHSLPPDGSGDQNHYVVTGSNNGHWYELLTMSDVVQDINDIYYNDIEAIDEKLFSHNDGSYVNLIRMTIPYAAINVISGWNLPSLEYLKVGSLKEYHPGNTPDLMCIDCSRMFWSYNDPDEDFSKHLPDFHLDEMTESSQADGFNIKLFGPTYFYLSQTNQSQYIDYFSSKTYVIPNEIYYSDPVYYQHNHDLDHATFEIDPDDESRLTINDSVISYIRYNMEQYGQQLTSLDIVDSTDIRSRDGVLQTNALGPVWGELSCIIYPPVLKSNEDPSDNIFRQSWQPGSISYWEYPLTVNIQIEDEHSHVDSQYFPEDSATSATVYVKYSRYGNNNKRLTQDNNLGGHDGIKKIVAYGVMEVPSDTINDLPYATDIEMPFLSSIGSRNFGNCTSLSCIFADGIDTMNFFCVESIGDDCFNNCPNLTSVNGRNITKIGFDSFPSGVRDLNLPIFEDYVPTYRWNADHTQKIYGQYSYPDLSCVWMPLTYDIGHILQDASPELVEFCNYNPAFHLPKTIRDENERQCFPQTILSIQLREKSSDSFRYDYTEILGQKPFGNGGALYNPYIIPHEMHRKYEARDQKDHVILTWFIPRWNDIHDPSDRYRDSWVPDKTYEVDYRPWEHICFDNRAYPFLETIMLSSNLTQDNGYHLSDEYQRYVTDGCYWEWPYPNTYQFDTAHDKHEYIDDDKKNCWKISDWRQNKGGVDPDTVISSLVVRFYPGPWNSNYKTYIQFQNWQEFNSVLKYAFGMPKTFNEALLYTNGLQNWSTTPPRTVSLGNDIEHIGSDAFYNCTTLQQITLTDRIKTIGDRAFYGCTALPSRYSSSIYISKNIEYIGQQAFVNLGQKSTRTGNHVYFEGKTLVDVHRMKNFDTWGLTDAMIHAEFGSGKTILTYRDGTTEEQDIQGDWTRSKSEEIGLINGNGDWLKDVVKVEVGQNVTRISDECFYNSNANEITGLEEIVLSKEIEFFTKNALRGCNLFSTFVVSQDNQTYTVTEDGLLLSKDETVLVAVPNAFTDVEIPDTVTKIDDYAFSYNNMTTLNLPDNVEVIGHNAFYRCQGLNSTLTLPRNLTYIGNNAFAYTGISGVLVIPNGVTYLGYRAFERCSELQSVQIPGTVSSIGEFAFSYCSRLLSLTIYDGPNSIGRNAFEYCTSLMDVDIPGSIEIVGRSAFTECRSLNILTIQNGVKRIEDYAFMYNLNLTAVELPESLEHVGRYAFSHSGLRTATIQGNGNASIGIYAFSGCDHLTTVTIGNGVKELIASTFSSCSSLSSVTLGNSLTYIGDNTFNSCSSLSSIVIPDSIIDIKAFAFFGCTNLSDVTIPDSVTSIERYAFANCSNLATIVVGNSVEKIGRYAFESTNITSALFKGKTLQQVKDIPDSNGSKYYSWSIPEQAIRTEF